MVHIIPPMKIIDTELNVCIDSDDYMPDDAVEKIVSFWKKYGSDKVCRDCWFRCKQGGEIIGTRMPDDIKTSTLSDLYGKHEVKGDKKLSLSYRINEKDTALSIISRRKILSIKL